MSKPTIVCVPGAWHTPEIYSKVLDILSGHGYPTVGLPLPSAGASPPHANFDEDVKGIRDCLVKLVEEGKDVVLVTHSYTGMPGAEAPAGLGKKERQAANLKGGVIRMVFIMAFAMPEGFAPTAGGAQYPEWMKMDPEVMSCKCLMPTFPDTIFRMASLRYRQKTPKRSSTTTSLQRRLMPGLRNSFPKASEYTPVQPLTQLGVISHRLMSLELKTRPPSALSWWTT